MTITIPTTYAEAVHLARRTDADTTITADRMSVHLGPVTFVATIPPPPWTEFPHGYLSRRTAP